MSWYERVRWGNVLRLLAVVGAIGVAASWPRVRETPSPAARPTAPARDEFRSDGEGFSSNAPRQAASAPRHGARRPRAHPGRKPECRAR